MLLGAGELGKEVIIELQRLGVEVIAVDRYPNAPGHQVAHRWHCIDMSDAKQLRQVIEDEQPDWIVPEIEAIATDVLAAIEAEGNAQIIPNARAVQLTMNREGIRRLAAEQLQLPTSAYAFAGSADEIRLAIDAGIGFPCLVKPVMSSSGKGQSMIRDEEDVQAAWDYAQSGGRVSKNRVIVEGFVDFDYEITLLTVRAKNPAGELETRFCAPIGHRQQDGDYVESWQPQTMSEQALQRSRDIARQVTDALGGRGLFGVELFIKGDQVWFSEVSPRPHDTGLVTLATQQQSEFALHARAILGLPVDTALTCPGASAVIYAGLDGSAITFSNIEQALSMPGTDLRLFGKPEAFQKRRMGVALARVLEQPGDNLEQARQRARQAAATVQTGLS